jgi:RNA polymerase sigma-70 factor (ECF subfamily)
MVHVGGSSDLDFKTVYETLYPVLFGIAYRITGGREKAEDLCHEAFIKYYEREKKFPDLDQTKYWLIRVIKNFSLNYEKKRARERKAYRRFEKTTPQYSKSGETEVLEREQETQTKQRVQQTLNQLPHKLRMVIVLKEYGGMNYKDIGNVLGISEGNVKTRVFRARERLQKLINESEL